MSRVVKIIKNASVKFGPLPVEPAEIDPATLTDYGCQVTEARITASANTTDVPATFCEPGTTINVPSSFTLGLNGLQDWGESGSFSEYLFINDAEVVAFAMYLEGADDPAAMGKVSLAAGDFGGPAGEVLVLTGSLPILGYPIITDSAGVSLRPSGASGATTGATAGTPGTWTPASATKPQNAAQANGWSIDPTPATAWTTGQYVQGSLAGAPGQMYWDGDSWAAGMAP